MSRLVKILIHAGVMLLLTLLTQIGGVVYAIALGITLAWRKNNSTAYAVLVFVVLYLSGVYLWVPLLASFGGRAPVIARENMRPANYATVLLCRNYVSRTMNQVLGEVSAELANDRPDIVISYLDGNFPFLNGFPLWPHLSHDDGNKLDLGFIYKNEQGDVTRLQKSVSGYGVYEPPRPGEQNTWRHCRSEGYFWYDYPRYLTFGTLHPELQVDPEATAFVVRLLLRQATVEKIFIEPHLANRWHLQHPKIRFHGCGAVRHDDHIHLQVIPLRYRNL